MLLENKPYLATKSEIATLGEHSLAKTYKVKELMTIY
jgi:hypothetical protein